jgi:hypothetical protein
MSRVSYWNTKNKNDWDILYLGQYKLPGYVRVSEEITFNYEEGKSQGNDGAPLTYKGRPNRIFSVSIRLVTEEDLNSWADLQVAFNNSTAGQQSSEFEINCPLAWLTDVKKVVITNISLPCPNSNDGMQITMKLKESFPATNTKTGTKKKVPTAGETGFSLAPNPTNH